MMIGLAPGRMEWLFLDYTSDRAEATKSDTYKLNYLYIIEESPSTFTLFHGMYTAYSSTHNIYHGF
jgi:hypothetical protein